MALVVKNLPANAGDVRDTGSISGSGRSPGGGHSNPLQYSRLENPMDRGAWRATVCRITKSRTRLKWLSTHACSALFSHKKNARMLFSTTWMSLEIIMLSKSDRKIAYDIIHMWNLKKREKKILMLFSTVVQPWRHIRIIWNIKKKTNKTQSQGPPKTNEMRSFCMQAGHWYRFKTHLRWF